MKRYIRSSTRGNSYPRDPAKQKLRDIVNDIYDVVEDRGIIDYFANIKSAGKGYVIDYFRFRKGWMDIDTAQRLKSDIEQVIEDLGYTSSAHVEVVQNSTVGSYLTRTYGYICYVVKVRVN